MENEKLKEVLDGIGEVVLTDSLGLNEIHSALNIALSLNNGVEISTYDMQTGIDWIARTAIRELKEITDAGIGTGRRLEKAVGMYAEA